MDNDGDDLIDEDFPDTDGDGIADCVDQEECDCLDNNGDGQVDEDCFYEFAFSHAAEGRWEAYIDGQLVSNGSGYPNGPETDAIGVEAGTHHVALHALATGDVGGFQGVVYVNGSPKAVTGDGQFTVEISTPAPGWETQLQSMPANVSYCNQSPNFLDGEGAQWLWTEACFLGATYPYNWYVAEILVCGE